MIKYALRCSVGHEFDGWFRSIADFDDQCAARTLSCPVCGAPEVAKAIMAPALASGRSRAADRLSEIQATMRDAALRARAYVEKNFEHVGATFPEEARRIHYGEVEPRLIYGEATPKEARELVEEGVAVAPLPAVRPDVEPAGPARPFDLADSAKPGATTPSGALPPAKKRLVN